MRYPRHTDRVKRLPGQESICTVEELSQTRTSICHNDCPIVIRQYKHDIVQWFDSRSDGSQLCCSKRFERAESTSMLDANASAGLGHADVQVQKLSQSDPWFNISVSALNSFKRSVTGPRRKKKRGVSECPPTSRHLIDERRNKQAVSKSKQSVCQWHHQSGLDILRRAHPGLRAGTTVFLSLHLGNCLLRLTD